MLAHGKSQGCSGVVHDTHQTPWETTPEGNSLGRIPYLRGNQHFLGNLGDTNKSWRHLLTRPAVVRRGLRFAVIVGAILIAINHGDAILRGDLGPERILKMALTVIVPYCVSVFSSVSALRHMEDRPC